MKKLYLFVSGLLLASCLNEAGVSPGNSNTFIRYYNGGNNDIAQGMEVTPDGGFILLATTRIQKQESDVPQFKVKLIKVDAQGNPLWQKLYPAIGSVTGENYTAGAIQLIPGGGYVVTGNYIQANGSSKVLLLTTDDNGDNGVINTYSDPTNATTSVNGIGLNVTATGNYVILANSGDNTMYLFEVDKTTFATVVSNPPKYTAGVTTLGNRLLLNSVTNKAAWTGVLTSSGRTGVRVVRTNLNAFNTDYDLLLSSGSAYTEGAKDIVFFGQDYAVTGSTNMKPDNSVGSDTDILFKRINGQTGEVLVNYSYTIENQNDEGKSISTTSDGGVIILGAVSSVGIGGRGDTDFFLIKLNSFGTFEWSSSFGSKFKDEAVTIRQTVDGGYVFLGTTTQGSLKIISLMKCDKNGKIE